MIVRQAFVTIRSAAQRERPISGHRHERSGDLSVAF
jgi:hypothetical protein